MWRRGTQEVEVFTKEAEEKRESGTTMRSMGESKGTQWNKGAASKRGGNVYERVDHAQRSGGICGV